MKVPNLQAYYVTANLAPISHLHETYHLPLWATIDVVDSHPTPLTITPSYFSPNRHKSFFYPIHSTFGTLLNTRQAWSHLIYLFYVYCVAHYSPPPPGVNSPGWFNLWTESGFSDVHSLLTPTRIMMFYMLLLSHKILLQEHFPLPTALSFYPAAF